MRDSELRRTVELPAQRAGLEIEAGLVEVIVGDVAGRAGALPLLSTALAETWERREGRRLTLAGYRAAGGVNGALARLAEDGYAAIPAPARPAARRILLRLCDAGDDAAFDLRRRLPLADVVDDSDHDGRAALDALADRRLLAVDGDTVEVAHESLLREWPRLRTWLEEDVEGRRVHRRLGDAARAWDADGRDPSELYRGTQLDLAADWAAGHADAPNRIEWAFLDTSLSGRDAERRREARRVRRLRALLVAVALALVVSLVTGAIAVGQRNRATDQGRLAEARELAAAATANLDVDPERSVLLALEAVDRSRAGDGSVLPEAEQALHDAVTASRAVLRVPGVGGAVQWSPDGSRVAAAGPEGTVDILDARTGDPLNSISGHDAPVNGIAFSPDGALVGTTGEDGFAKIWDLETGEELHALESPAERDALAPSFSPDGSLFAAAWLHEGFIRILDLTSGRIVQEIQVEGSPRSTAFDPTGARIVVALDIAPAVVVDVRSGEVVFTLDDPGSSDAAWSPDGASIVTAGDDGVARIFDAQTGRGRFALLGHGDRVTDVDWSPDSARVVTASADGTATLWRVTEGGGREMFTLSAQDTRGGIASVAFSPDGSRIVTGDVENRATIVWDVSIAGDAELANLPAVAFASATAAFTPDGRYLLVGNATGGVTVWDAQTLTTVRTLGTPASSSSKPPPSGDLINPPVTTGHNVTALEVSPDGRLAAAAITDSTHYVQGSSLRIWDVETGQEPFHVRPRGFVDDVAWSPDGKLLAMSTTNLPGGVDGVAEGSVAIVDRSGREVAFLPDEEPFVQILSLAFTPDGERLIGSRSPMLAFDALWGEVAIWNWEDGQLERSFDTGGDEAVRSPNGDLVVSTPRNYFTGSQVAQIWDWATGQHLRTLAGHSGSVTRAAFGPDGSRLATASTDGTVRLWDPRTGEQQLMLRGHNGLVGSVAFNPDGSRLASVSADGTVRIWALELDELIEVAERGLTRSLTDGECRQYLHTERCPRP
jgi:WD40 repeat protein